jgi:hemolysin activation/secretion protein
MSHSGAFAEAVDRMTPPAVVPKEPPKTAPRDGVTLPPRTPRDPSGDKPLIPDQPALKLNGVVLVKSDKEIVPDGIPNSSGVIIKGIPFLDRPDFRKMVLTRHIGHLLTENAIRDLEDDIIIFCRDHGKLLVDVILPEQTIQNGTIQLWFLEGRVGKVAINNPGRKWFKDSIFSSQLHLRSGEVLDSEALKDDLNWLNNNPFRQVEAAFKPGDKLGSTDIDIRVEDRIPFRPYIGYENSGTTNTGTDRLLFGFNWGNAFGLDHQLNYQYAMDVQNEHVSAHSASYIIPLPWRHTVMVYGSYVDAKADSGAGFGGTSAEGTSWQASIRYSLPLPDIYKYRHELAVGFDFKRADNDLLAGGTNILQQTAVDVAQFAFGYSGLLPDPWGKTSLGIELYYSPGGITDHNDDSDFNALRVGTKADYLYVRANAERITRLPYNFSWIIRGWAQLASERLQPSEELALGGYNTIRGYNERVHLGDNGYILNNELRTPPWAIGLFGLDDQLQFLGFFDFGRARVKDFSPSDVIAERTLYSVGLGLRYTVSRNFSFRFDYGVPLTEKEINSDDSRFHVGALLSF